MTTQLFILWLSPLAIWHSVSLTVLSSTVALAFWVCLRAFNFISFKMRHVDQHGNPIPSGPRAPLISSYISLGKYPELVLDKWAKKFGPLYSVWFGNQLFVVISDPVIARDLLVNEGATVSSRKEYYIKSQTIFRGGAITSTPYGETWRKHRRLAAFHLSSHAVDMASPILQFESVVFMRSLFEETKGGLVAVDPQALAGRFALNNMLSITFGTRTNSLDEPLVKEALGLGMEYMNLTGPLSNVIDLWEFLQYFPSKTHARAEALHQGLKQLYGGMVVDIARRVENGEDVPRCMARTLVECSKAEGLDFTDWSMLASAFTLGGVQTTASIIAWFLALMPSHPEIQAKAHEELDRVVGRHDLPTIADEKRLPYIRAIIKEIERTRNPFWLGNPHYTLTDLTYKGHFIPARTTVILNSYTMHHNPERYPEPHRFMPERYLGDDLSCADSANQPDALKRDHWTFGAGRRTCQGIYMAERELWLSISRILWCFELRAVPGQSIDLTEYDGLSGRSPVPFKLHFVPRHAKVAEVIGANVLPA